MKEYITVYCVTLNLNATNLLTKNTVKMRPELVSFIAKSESLTLRAKYESDVSYSPYSVSYMRLHAVVFTSRKEITLPSQSQGKIRV